MRTRPTARNCRSAVKSSRKVRLTAAARADVRDIRRFTARQWGIRQRDVYSAQLYAGLERLVQFPELGQERNDLSAGCRAVRVGQHIVYYRVTEAEIVISRVLHMNQDATTTVIP